MFKFVLCVVMLQVWVDEFRIQFVCIECYCLDVSWLVNYCYFECGYWCEQVQDVIELNVMMFSVIGVDGDIFGMLGICFDVVQGFSADDVFVDEMVLLCGLKWCEVCEFMQLVLDNQVVSKFVLVVLFYVVYLYVYKVQGIGLLVIEVNLWYVLYYWWMLDFKVCFGVKMNVQVNVLVVLLSLELVYVEQQIVWYGG